jgi:protein-tyrosine phosphatase
MFDLHSHILPGLDDGASNLEVSLLMLRIAAESGTMGIVATPHVIEGEWLPAWPTIVSSCATLQNEARALALNISVFPGAEVYLCLDILGKIKEPGPYCLNGGRYMLVELPAAEIPLYADEFFFTLQARGIIPVLAHPERHSQIIKSPAILQAWINKGVLVQVNAPSITGRMGERIKRSAEVLLTRNMVHCIGSDAHGVRTRRPILTEAANRITALLGQDRARNISQNTGKLIIYNQDFDCSPVAALTKTEQPRGLAGWLSGLWT